MLEAREASAAYRAVSLDRPRTDEEEDGDSYADAVGADDPGYRLAEASATVQRLMRVLSEREREVLRLRFEEDLTQSEIGARVGVSQMHVSRLIRQSIARLREEADQRRIGIRSAHGPLGPRARSTCSRTIRRSCTRRAASRGRSPSGSRRARSSRITRCTSARTSSWSTGEVEVDAGGATVHGGPGFVAVFDPHERHEVRATEDARLLLVLAPWPGDGHPGARD